MEIDHTIDFLEEKNQASIESKMFPNQENFLTFAVHNTDSKKQNKEGKHRDLVGKTSQTLIYCKQRKQLPVYALKNPVEIPWSAIQFIIFVLTRT